MKCLLISWLKHVNGSLVRCFSLKERKAIENCVIIAQRVRMILTVLLLIGLTAPSGIFPRKLCCSRI
jgi:Na+/pantothenate symporter